MAKRARVKTVVNEHVFLDRFLMKQLCVRQKFEGQQGCFGVTKETL